MGVSLLIEYRGMNESLGSLKVEHYVREGDKDVKETQGNF